MTEDTVIMFITNKAIKVDLLINHSKSTGLGRSERMALCLKRQKYRHWKVGYEITCNHSSCDIHKGQKHQLSMSDITT